MQRISISDTKKNIADGILVADSNTKIPALDGSLVTVLNASNITTGTVSNARLDTGTAANKIVILDGSGNLPAVDASLLTGIVTATISASDPTISTNPSGGVGTEWLNSTSGEMYICTDATTGANVWKNVGEGTGSIGVFGGETYGYVCGGQSGPSNWSPPHFVSDQISKFAFASGNASDTTANLAVEVRYQSSHSSTTHGYSVTGLTTGASVSYTHLTLPTICSV